jgi:hypothetical protein
MMMLPCWLAVAVGPCWMAVVPLASCQKTQETFPWGEMRKVLTLSLREVNAYQLNTLFMLILG